MRLTTDTCAPVGASRGMRARTRRLERAAALGRAAGFLSLVWVVAALFAARSARADLDEALIGFGAETMRLADARQQSAPTALSINGARLLVSSGMDDRSVSEVLDVFESRCRELDADFTAQIEQASEPVAESERWLDGTIREGDDERAYVACLDLGASGLDPAALLARVQRFLDTGDLAAVGELRYVFAERAEHGTHFVAYWTQGSFPLRAMFPEEGDAPGRDVEGVARPPGARRILSASAGDEPYSLTVYAGASAGVDELERFYRTSLVEQGFRLLEAEPGRAYESGGDRGLVAEREGRIVTVVVAQHPEVGATVEVVEAR